MADDIWYMTFEVTKVNGEPYNKAPEQTRMPRENVPGMIKRGAEQFCDRYDFARVKITAKNVNTGEVFDYDHRSEAGTQSDWRSQR